MCKNKIILEPESEQLFKDAAISKNNNSIGQINATPENAGQGLAKLVLTVIELLRRLMEKQAIRRIDNGTLTDSQIDEMGETFYQLELKMEELKKVFDLQDEDLNLNLGPLGDLM